jgi:hypothetical protein
VQTIEYRRAELAVLHNDSQRLAKAFRTEEEIAVYRTSSRSAHDSASSVSDEHQGRSRKDSSNGSRDLDRRPWQGHEFDGSDSSDDNDDDGGSSSDESFSSDGEYNADKASEESQDEAESDSDEDFTDDGQRARRGGELDDDEDDDDTNAGDSGVIPAPVLDVEDKPKDSVCPEVDVASLGNKRAPTAPCLNKYARNEFQKVLSSFY